MRLFCCSNFISNRLFLSIYEKVINGFIKTYEEWKKEEFPFWSVDTIKRTIRKLEKNGYIISTTQYNRMKMDKTKWYRIDYLSLYGQTLQDAPTRIAKSAEAEMQIAPTTQGNLPLAINKEIKSIKNKHVENDLDVASVIDYLNEKAKKQFKATSKTTERLLKARYQEGYNLDDFKKVIDRKVKEWLYDPVWQKYLRPSTLFNATNFENYLKEAKGEKVEESSSPKPFELDLSKGEN